MLDKRIVVTGSTYGMGASVVAALCAEGAQVASMGRSIDLGDKQASSLTQAGPGEVRFHRCDVSSRAQVKAAFAAAAAWMGGIDALVHVAAIEEAEPAESATDESWDRQFNINVKGTFYTNQEVFPYLKEKGGRIVNFGSSAGSNGTVPHPVYAATKGAVLAWSRSIARAWGRYDIGVNVIAPAIWTPMYDTYRARLSPEALAKHDEASAERTLIGGKMGDPDRDLAPVIVFLVGDGARFITGQLIPVDGGRLMTR